MRDLDQWLRQLRRTPGIEVTGGSGKHYQVRYRGVWIATVPCTPGGGRGLANAKAAVRRALR